MTWRVLVSAPYFLPVLEEFRSRLEAEGVEIVANGTLRGLEGSTAR